MKTSIYIPDDLKKRMDKISKKHDVNWSALACAAFTAKLNTLERETKGSAPMDNVIERLRLSKAKTEDKETAAGREAGAKWARERAEAVHLERLDIADDGARGWDFDKSDDTYSASQRFYFIIEPQDYGNHREAAEFWGFDGMIATPTYVQGFAVGAMQVWDDVSDKL